LSILKQGEAGVPIAEIPRQHNISKATSRANSYQSALPRLSLPPSGNTPTSKRAQANQTSSNKQEKTRLRRTYEGKHAGESPELTSVKIFILNEMPPATPVSRK
jgi:hypothetical protein